MMAELPPISSLVVDDEHDLREVLRRTLERQGHRVATAADGAEAWAVFQEVRPELVVSDIMMPGMDGIALLEKIRTLAPHAEVVLVTGFANAELVIRALRSGAANFIEKPVRPAEVVAHVSGSVERIRQRAERERLARELEAARRRGELDGRLVTLGRLLAGLAHEIHNPLTFVLGNAQLVRMQLSRLVKEAGISPGSSPADLAAEASGLLEDLEFGARRIQQMVQTLKGFASPSQRVAAPVAVAQLVERSVMVAKAKQPVGATTEVRLPEADVRVLCDALEVESCLVNLLVNAYEAFQSRGGRVTVEAEVLPFDTGQVGGMVEIAVADDGPGIPRGIVDEVYTPFFTRKQGGLGLGLSIAYEAIRRNGGQLEIRTVEGEGSRVLVRLPLASEIR